jgi:hypothetical protein
MVTSRRNSNRTRLAQAAVASVLILGLFYLHHRGQQEKSWQAVQGNVREKRISPAYATQVMGSHLVWKAEYRVGYSGAGHEYSVWADSGVRGDSEADVQLRLTKVSSCWVRYKPEQPEISVASCR